MSPRIPVSIEPAGRGNTAVVVALLIAVTAILVWRAMTIANGSVVGGSNRPPPFGY